MSLIFIDIETVPDQRPGAVEEIAATIKPPGVLKKAESIAEWERESKPGAVQEAWLKTALDGTYGQVCAISYAVDDREPVGLFAPDLSAQCETALLRQFVEDMRDMYSGTSGMRPVLCGHNLIGFDLPFIWRRCVIRGVKPPLWWPRSVKPWSDHVADTMLMWAGDRGTIGMDRLCKALGIAGKDGMTGADVWPMVQAGRIAEVSAYCSDDVRRTRAIYQRLTFAEAA
jgi:hypothetical protein